MTTEPKNYDEFWDFYVSEHSRPLTRLLHFFGTSLAILLLIFFIVRGQWYLFPAFFMVGYAFAWFAHFVVERNRPASFRYPLWSFISDFKMIWYMLTMRMSAEAERVSNDISGCDGHAATRVPATGQTGRRY